MFFCRTAPISSLHVNICCRHRSFDCNLCHLVRPGNPPRVFILGPSSPLSILGSASLDHQTFSPWGNCSCWRFRRRAVEPFLLASLSSIALIRIFNSVRRFWCYNHLGKIPKKFLHSHLTKVCSILTPEIYYVLNSFVLFFVSKKYLKKKNPYNNKIDIFNIILRKRTTLIFSILF